MRHYLIIILILYYLLRYFVLFGFLITYYVVIILLYIFDGRNIFVLINVNLVKLLEINRKYINIFFCYY